MTVKVPHVERGGEKGHLYILHPSLLPSLLSLLLSHPHYLPTCIHMFRINIPLPLHHWTELQRLETVLASISAREGVEKDSMDLLLKFRKQTVRRLQHLQDIKKVQCGVLCCGAMDRPSRLNFLYFSLFFFYTYLFFCIILCYVAFLCLVSFIRFSLHCNIFLIWLFISSFHPPVHVLSLIYTFMYIHIRVLIHIHVLIHVHIHIYTHTNSLQSLIPY